MTTMAMGERNSLPVPRPSAVGSMPSTMAALVMRMGRSRRGPALRTASAAESPSRTCWSAPSTRRMPFLVTRPMSRMIPMSEPMLTELPVRKSARVAPTSAKGSAAMMVSGWRNDSNWLASTR